MFAQKLQGTALAWIKQKDGNDDPKMNNRLKIQ